MLGAILAGGRSTRMGGDKAAIEVEGRTMLDWVVSALTAACDQVVVAGGSRPPDLALEIVPDPEAEHRGPLAGLVGVFGAYPDRRVALVAVDQPWVRAATISGLATVDADLPVAPVDGGVRQTTCAVYPPSVASVARAELAAGGSLQSLLDIVSFEAVIDWGRWGEDGRSWYSADTPDSLAAGLARFGPPPG